jgi:hypothetical protein
MFSSVCRFHDSEIDDAYSARLRETVSGPRS